MAAFRHHTDGWVFISSGDSALYENESQYPYDWWVTQEPEYYLNHEYVYREYYQGNYHRVFTNTDQLEAPEGYPWLKGDQYIAKKSIYDAAYAAYLNPTPTIEQERILKFNSLLAQLFEERRKLVAYGGNNYFSDDVHYQRLLTESELYTRIGATPVGFYVLDENRVQVAFTLTPLIELVTLIQKFYHECNLVYDYHYDNIKNLTDEELLRNYDVTTGWAATPYTGI